MKPIHKSYLIDAPASKVWQALVDPDLIEKWGAGPAIMDDQVGTEFSLWGGDIHGKNMEVEKERKLVQEWYEGDWPAASIASFTLSEQDGKTRLEFEHTNVPKAERKDIDEGWDLYYLGAIKSLLEDR